jgi:SAM-dependent methyltransferase
MTLHRRISSPSRRALLGTALACPIAALAQALDPIRDLDTPFVTTPQNVVDAMLDLAQVRRGDRLLDLGSGDGRIVITAAKRFDVPGLGVEIDPRLVQRAREGAVREGVADKARFEVQDLFDTDLTQATVITLYLLPDVNELLKPRLLKLKPGTRIVSHDWGMRDWPAEREIVVEAPGKTVGLAKSSRLTLWIVK